MKKQQIILGIVFIAIIAYPIFLMGEEVGRIIANNPLKGIAIILIMVGISIPIYFLGVRTGRLLKSKFIKNK